jgi:hypothetical protein
LAKGKVENAIEIINKEPFSQSEDSRKRFAIYLYFILKLDNAELYNALQLLEESCGFTRTYMNQNKFQMKDLMIRDKKTFSILI